MASIQYVVNAVDSASGVFAKIAASADGLDKQLADLSKRVATPEVDLKDAKFTLGVVNAAKRLDALSAKVADPEVEVDAAKAQTEILRITAMLDRLDGKRVTAHVKVDSGGALGGLLRGLAGAGGGAGGLGGIAGTAGGALGIGAAIGPLLIGLAQVTGALAAAGAGAGAFAALSIPQFTAVSKSLQQINADTNAYERATTAASKSLALKHIRQDWADISPAQRQAVRGIQSLQSEFGRLSAKLAPITFKVFNEGLKIAGKLLPDLLPFARAAGNAIDGLLKGLDKFVTPAAGTGLHGKLAAISGLPPPTGFQKFLTILQGLSGPAITALGKGLGQIAAAVGNLIIVAASPDSIRTLSRVLGFLAGVVNVISWAIGRASGNMQKWVDIAHQTAAKFDEFRHDTARVFAAVAHTFDTLRHSVAVTWNAMWAATIGAQIRSLAAIVGWFEKLPGRVLGALRGLGHSLYAFGHAALNEFWSGLKSVAGSIFGWVGNFVKTIWSKVKSFFGISSPSSLFYDIGKNLMLGLFHGIRDHAHHAANAARAAASRVANVGAGAGRWAPLVRRALAMEGLSPGLLRNVLYQMQTESGGNVNAINLGDINARMGDPSRGLMQVIGSTFAAYHWPGTSGNIYDPLANIAAALNYARHVYGPTLMSGGMGIGSGHGYAAGSWNVPYTGPAVVHQGEMIIPAPRAAAIRSGRSGPLVHVENQNFYTETDPLLVAQRLSFLVTAAGLGS